MDMELIAGIVIALISAVGGITTKHFLDGRKEAKAGRKTEAQRIADQRDEALAERDRARQERDQANRDRDRAHEDRDAARRCRQEWQDSFYSTRWAAVQNGVPPHDLPRPPDSR